MSTTPNPTPPNSHLDADLLGLAADLDRLAQSEHAAAPDLETRLMQSTLASLHNVQPVALQAAELGAIDRAAAPADLEATVFDHSAPALREAAPSPVLRHIGPSEISPRRHARDARRMWWSGSYLRLAATLALVSGAAIVAYIGLNPQPITTPTDRVPLDALFAAIENQPIESETATDFDPDKLSEWLSEGAAS